MARIIDETTKSVAPSMFLHGITGHGKSTWSCKGGFPWAILLEAKAESVLKQINPNAVGISLESVRDIMCLLEVLGEMHTPTGRGMLNALYALFTSGDQKPSKYVVLAYANKLARVDRIVLDSYTGLTESLPEWIRQASNAPGVLQKALEIQEYGHLGSLGLALVKAIQLTGLPSVILGRSISKRIGIQERIVPDSVGKSVASLPGQLLPTAEARFDPELGYVIDTTPVDHSQRCGLPWLPQVFQGSCLDYLRMIEAGPQGGTPAEPEKAEPKQEAAAVQVDPPAVSGAESPSAQAEPSAVAAGASSSPSDATADPEWVDLLTRMAAGAACLGQERQKAQVESWESHYKTDPEKAKTQLREFVETDAKAREIVPHPEKDPEAYRAAFGQIVKELQAAKIAAQKKAEHPQAVTDFVDGVSPEMAAPAHVQELLDLMAEHKVKPEAMWAYAVSKGQAMAKPDGSVNWSSVSEAFATTILPHLKDPAKRRAFIPNIHQKFAK